MTLTIYKRIYDHRHPISIQYLIRDADYDCELTLGIEPPTYDDEPPQMYYYTTHAIEWSETHESSWLDLLVTTGVTLPTVQKLYYTHDFVPRAHMSIQSALMINEELSTGDIFTDGSI